MPLSIARFAIARKSTSGSWSAASLPATRMSFSCAVGVHASWSREARRTRPTYSVPPLVVSAKSFWETRSRSSVNGVSTRTQPVSFWWPSLPNVSRATLRRGAGRASARSLTTAQRFWRAALIRPSMLPLVSRQMAISTAGRSSVFGVCAGSMAANRVARVIGYFMSGSFGLGFVGSVAVVGDEHVLAVHAQEDLVADAERRLLARPLEPLEQLAVRRTAEGHRLMRAQVAAQDDAAVDPARAFAEEGAVAHLLHVAGLDAL